MADRGVNVCLHLGNGHRVCHIFVEAGIQLGFETDGIPVPARAAHSDGVRLNGGIRPVLVRRDAELDCRQSATDKRVEDAFFL